MGGVWGLSAIADAWMWQELHQRKIALEAHQVLAAIDQQRGAGDGRIFKRELHRAGHIGRRGRFECGFGQGVAEKIGVLVPELLVEQVDDRTRRVSRADMRMQRLRQHDGRAGVAVQMFVQRGKTKAGGGVMLEGRGAVDDRIDPTKMGDDAGQQAAQSATVLIASSADSR